MQQSPGQQMPHVPFGVPGEQGKAWVERLAASESPAFTARRARRSERSGLPEDPIVWVRALGSNVEDADGNRYVDLTSGFGACALGHRHAPVVSAVRAQAGELMHGLGDLHPSDVKVAVLEGLCALGPWNASRAVITPGGADAVEVALKTATLHTGRHGFVAFDCGYHGLSYGALSVTGFSKDFREPFEAQLFDGTEFLSFPEPRESGSQFAHRVRERIRRMTTQPAAVLFEPIQGRGGVRPFSGEQLLALRQLCTELGIVLIADEIMTGLGRTGALWASVERGCVPDLICAGKALGGGMPVGACVGSAEVMAAWGTPDRVPIHTGTFYGHPLACAAAKVMLEELTTEGMLTRVRDLGKWFAARASQSLPAAVERVAVHGAMVGLDLCGDGSAVRVARALLERGFITLPAGARGQVLQLLPPYNVPKPLLEAFVDTLITVLRKDTH